jgi:phosphoenolpyruvate synthase/pyruvate phosphate dikinase
MNRIYFPDSGEPADVALVGGKANRLAMPANHGYRVPPLLCLTPAAYDLCLSTRPV